MAFNNTRGDRHIDPLRAAIVTCIAAEFAESRTCSEQAVEARLRRDFPVVIAAERTRLIDQRLLNLAKKALDELVAESDGAYTADADTYVDSHTDPIGP